MQDLPQSPEFKDGYQADFSSGYESAKRFYVRRGDHADTAAHQEAQGVTGERRRRRDGDDRGQRRRPHRHRQGPEGAHRDLAGDDDQQRVEQDEGEQRRQQPSAVPESGQQFCAHRSVLPRSRERHANGRRAPGVAADDAGLARW